MAAPGVLEAGGGLHDRQVDLGVRVGLGQCLWSKGAKQLPEKCGIVLMYICMSQLHAGHHAGYSSSSSTMQNRCHCNPGAGCVR